MPDKKILAGREAVEKYRANHLKLYEGGWSKNIPKKHTPLLEKLLADLAKNGFTSLDEFFTASDKLDEAVPLEVRWS